MPLKAALATILTALALPGLLAVPGFARSALDQQPTPPPATPSEQSVPAEAPQRPASGITPYQNLPVAQIAFPGLSAADGQRMLAMIPLKTGQRLDRDSVRQSILVLNATGRFSDIRVEAERDLSSQVFLAFITQPNYFIGSVNVEGAPAPPAANQVANASKLQLGELYTADKIARARDSIRQLMEENGYYLSRLSEEEKRHPETQQVDILFTLVSGARAHVGRVTAAGEFSYSQKQIQDIAKLHPGDAVSVQRVSGALDHLRNKFQKQKRLLAQVAISKRAYRPEANAVDYALAITPGPRVDLTTEGFRISRGTLKKNVPIYEEGALDDDLLNEGRRNLLNYLQAQGYFDAKVTFDKKSSPSGDQLRVLYDIDPGSRHKLVKVQIAGNTWFPQEKLMDQLQLQPASRLFAHGRYSQALLNQDIRGLEAVFRDSGFQQVKVTSRVEDNYQGRENQIAVTLMVDQGPQTLVSELHIEGNLKIAQGQFPPLNTVPGQPYAESNIGADRDILLSYYLNRGFSDATFEATAQADPGAPDRMDVVYTIHEGEQTFVDQVVLAGLVHTRPFVVQREVQVKPGDPVSQIDMLKTQQNLYNLLIFSQVNTAVQNPDGKEQYKNVLVDVQEAKRYTFNYGVGLEFQTGQPGGPTQPLGATGVSPRVSFGVTRLNFRGRDHTLTFKSNVGRLQQRGLLSYQAPRWLNNPNWTLTLTTFYDNTLDVTTFTSQRLEGTAQAEQVVSRKGPDGPPSILLDYRFTYRRVKATNLAISPDQIPLLSQPTRVGMPNFSFVRNKRDNDLESTKGSYTTLDGGVADSHFASEADFGRVLIQNSTYYAFGKNRPGGKKYVIARSTRIGVEPPYGNTLMPAPGQQCPTVGDITCLPLAERFFTGGGNSHRGFGLNQAGPRDPITGFPLGGTALFLNNLELRLPPPTLRFFQQNLSFTIFHDVGNVFTNGHDMLHSLLQWRQKDPQLCVQPSPQGQPSQCNFNYVSSAVGVGVRYKTPVGPIRLDLGYNLNPPAFPSCQSSPGAPSSLACPADQVFVPERASHFNFFFSIGQTF